MTRTVSVSALFAALFVCLLASSVQAQVTRTFVSGAGTANSSCAYTEPCRFFTQAVAALPAQGGEIDVLDPGSYGQVTISNSVSIIGRGWTTITATSDTPAISITGSGNVNISGVQLDGGGNGKYGIDFTGSGTLHIQDSVIRNFKYEGIFFQPVAASQVFVSDTLLADNGYDGLYIVSSSGVTGSIDHVRAENNTYGGFNMVVGATSTLSISNSVAANSLGSGAYGVSAQGGGAAAIATINVSDSVIENNNYGIFAGSYGDVIVRSSTVAGSTGAGIYSNGQSSPATVYVTRSTINGNATGISTSSGGTVYSYGDNNLFGNGTPGSFTSPPQTYQ
jgi:hypothetical protein